MKSQRSFYALSLGCILALSLPSELLAKDSYRTLYVSTEGSDRNTGTKERPFKTLVRARDEARKLKKKESSAVRVFLREGVYPVSSTLRLQSEDSGTAEDPTVYASAPGEIAKIFGGKKLEREWFRPVKQIKILNRVIDQNARKKLLFCDLGSKGITNFGLLQRRGFALPTPQPPLFLYIGGERMPLARYPNPGEKPLRMNKVLDKGPVKGSKDFMKRGGAFSYEDQRMDLWSAAEEPWLNGVISKDWALTFNRIHSIEPKTKKVTLAYGEHYGILNWKNDFFFVENLLEEIDQPGEYYLDRKSGILYIYPTENFEDAEITVSMMQETMIRIDGAKHVTFKNIVFDTSRGTAFGGSGDAITLESCEFLRLGMAAVHLKGKEHRVSSCEIHSVGGTAISLEGGDFDSLSPSGSVVENCHIHHWGFWTRVYCPAVSLRGVGHVVRHSEFHHFPHNAIEIRGNDHLIEYNLFHDGPLDFKDMGVIYGNLGKHPHHRGTVIRRNFFRETAKAMPKQNVIYPDNGTMDWLIEENIFYRSGPEGKTIGANGGSYLNIRNNIFIDCPTTFDQSCFLATWNKKSLPGYQKRWEEIMSEYDFKSMPHGKRYPGLLSLLKEDRVRPNSSRFEKNLIWNPTVPLLHESAFSVRGGDLSLVQGKDNYISTEDPGFVDWEGMDFSMKKGGDVFRKIPGFQTIPFSEIGLRGKVGP